MEYMTVKEASNKWNISERRVRKLLMDKRLSGTLKIGKSYLIPIDAKKPHDKRKKNSKDIIVNIDDSFFDEINILKKKLDDKRPLSKNALASLKESIYLEWTYNSNAIEGNSLSLKETKVVLEGITIGGKLLAEHLEAINHAEAILFLEELINDKKTITEYNIKSIHQLILKGIDNKNAGIYRNVPVTIKGAIHIPPSHFKVAEEMEKLIMNYTDWKYFHPVVRASLLHGEFVKIHPFIDGNGRTSRLIMNLELINNGYNPVIIKVEDRLKYYETLDKAHVTSDYTEFIKFICDLQKRSLIEYINFLE